MQRTVFLRDGHVPSKPGGFTRAIKLPYFERFPTHRKCKTSMRAVTQPLRRSHGPIVFFTAVLASVSSGDNESQAIVCRTPEPVQCSGQRARPALLRAGLVSPGQAAGLMSREATQTPVVTGCAPGAEGSSREPGAGRGGGARSGLPPHCALRGTTAAAPFLSPGRRGGADLGLGWTPQRTFSPPCQPAESSCHRAGKGS